MSILIIIVIAIVGLIALLLIAALFTKKGYEIEREIIINKPKAEVFNYVKHICNQDKYSKWNKTDLGMKKDYKGTDGTVGFVYAWDSQNKQAGAGEQEIKKIADGERMESEIRFIRPFSAVAASFIATQNVSEQQTKVKWGIQSTMKYPMNIILSFMNMDKMLGKDMEVSLGDLKVILEK
ncbi:MAG: SRPBCC family protein [Bacteroidetes bacterium]|nr:SRPBCC family protein [Bacteroidota bacterium]